MILGLTGSVGSGKSTVADMLRLSARAEVIDADAIVHRLQEPGQACHAAIVKEFGEEALAEDGTLHRRNLGKIVFGNPERLKALNAIVHPMVWDETKAQLARLTGHPLVVLMVPLLYEVGADKLCDMVAVVTVSEEERIRRLMERDGLSPQQIKDRLAAQMPQQEKENRADFIIDNSGTLEQTMAQVKTMLTALAVPQQ